MRRGTRGTRGTRGNARGRTRRPLLPTTSVYSTILSLRVTHSFSLFADAWAGSRPAAAAAAALSRSEQRRRPVASAEAFARASPASRGQETAARARGTVRPSAATLWSSPRRHARRTRHPTRRRPAAGAAWLFAASHCGTTARRSRTAARMEERGDGSTPSRDNRIWYLILTGCGSVISCSMPHPVQGQDMAWNRIWWSPHPVQRTGCGVNNRMWYGQDVATATSCSCDRMWYHILSLSTTSCLCDRMW